MGTLQIDVLGTSFTIQAKEDSQYLETLLEYFKQITTQVESTGLRDPLRIAIVSGIMLCDELYKEKSKNLNLKKLSPEPKELAEVEKITLKMIEHIDRALS